MSYTLPNAADAALRAVERDVEQVHLEMRMLGCLNQAQRPLARQRCLDNEALLRSQVAANQIEDLAAGGHGCPFRAGRVQPKSDTILV